ncbi:MAG: acyl-CoA thioesterase-2 [Gammaproteobacteria bacterium]
MTMSPKLQELVSLLKLERLENNLFRGPSRDIGTNRVYGGQVLGQAIKAAQYTVDENRNIHSLHAYFLREGDHDSPIIYEVDRSRDGNSFSARRVVAIQHGRPIFTLSASFQVDEEGLEFGIDIPDVPGPDELLSVTEYDSQHLEKLPEKFQRLMKLSAPFEIKPVGLEEGFNSGDFSPCRHFWLKTIDELPQEPQLHRSILAYVSDYGLLTTTLIPHGLRTPDTNLIMASIDHAMWFHRPFRMDEWMLYSCEAISTSNARGLAKGHFFRQDGKLLASTSQEGLVRQRTEAKS